MGYATAAADGVGAGQSPFADPGDNTAIYMLVDPRTGRVHYVGQSVAPSERINQHIEEFDEKGWDHPKTAWIGDMLRQGVYAADVRL